MKASLFTESPLLFCCSLPPDIRLGFARIIRNGGAGAVLGLMRSIHFDAQGFNRTYWDFFSAFGLFSRCFSCLPRI